MVCELQKNKTLKAFHFALVESLVRTVFFLLSLYRMRVLCAFIVYFTFAIVHYDLFFSFMLTDEWNDSAQVGECICIVRNVYTPLIVYRILGWQGGTCNIARKKSASVT